MDTKDNPKKEYAFPSKEGDIKNDDKGLTVRDYFAAKAMATLLNRMSINFHLKDISEESYKMADAMLKVRKDSLPD